VGTKRLSKADDISRDVIGIHGSDNAYEAQHMLTAIFADKTFENNRQFAETLNLTTGLLSVNSI